MQFRPIRAFALVAAVLMAAATGVGVSATPAQAAACSGDTGVTVVVDFNSLGGGVTASCSPGGGGRTAAALFSETGSSLTYAQRVPGFVCRVDGTPASDPCVNASPANAFWSLWWTDGTSDSWKYSSVGAGSLKIPDGGSVAFSWDDIDGKAPPSAPATARAATPSNAAPSNGSSPSTGSSAGGTARGGSGGGTSTKKQTKDHAGSLPQSTPDSASASDTVPPRPGQSAAASSAPSPTSGSSVAAKSGAKRSPKTKPGKVRSDASRPRSTPQAPDTGADVPDPVPSQAEEAQVVGPASQAGLPSWIAPALILALFALGGVVALRRRTQAD